MATMEARVLRSGFLPYTEYVMSVKEGDVFCIFLNVKNVEAQAKKWRV